ncbi:hypothetical protein V6N13_002153 [Hibiscus sabdariffa]|uniref:C2H2-type domain-containing protein n=1 Tax=Hibiscus sabdariffa TaxID=183260 RepID=A0ABR2C1Z9_9ROSI
MVSAAASLAFPAICVYCYQGFESSKAFYRHLRIHRQARSETEILHINSPKRERERSLEDDGFGCFACDESFSSMQLLCRHVRKTHGGSRAPQESNSNCLSEAETTLKLGIESTVSPSNDQIINLLKDMPNWSQTKKRGWKKITTDDDVVYDAVPLRFYIGPEHPLMQRKKKKKKKKKTEESMTYQDTLMEGATDSESTVSLFGNCVTTTKKPETQNELRSGHGRRSMKKAMAVKGVHQCEICGKTFTMGQALGGHKTLHRVKDPWKAELVQAKTKQGSCSEVRECVTRMLLPGTLPEQARLSEEARPKKMLDLDLNIPYQENFFQS